MKIKAVILSILFFSFFVFAEESDTGEFYDENDCGDTGCVDKITALIFMVSSIN